MNEIITDDYFPGKDCHCEARSSYECGCEDADWTPKEVYDLRSARMALKAFAESTANLAKSLKAERDEAREQYNNLATEHMLAINKICGERDKTELDEEMKFHHRTHSELVNANCKMLDSQNDAKQLADRLTALELHSTSELARLEQERDEALSQIVQAECRAERFCQERDEARNALMKIEDLFIDGTDIYADRENMGMIFRNALEEAK